MEIAPRKYFTDNILPCNARMYAAALAITGSPEDAADAVQTAMLRRTFAKEYFQKCRQHIVFPQYETYASQSLLVPQERYL